MTRANVIPLVTYRQVAELVSELEDLVARLSAGQELEARVRVMERRMIALIHTEQENLVNQWRQRQCTGKWHLRRSA